MQVIYRGRLHRRRRQVVVGGSGRNERGRPVRVDHRDRVRYQPVLTELERSTRLVFCVGNRGFTRDAHALDLRQVTAWCWQQDRRLFDVHRGRHRILRRHLEDAAQGCTRPSPGVLLLAMAERVVHHVTQSAPPSSAGSLRREGGGDGWRSRGLPGVPKLSQLRP